MRYILPICLLAALALARGAYADLPRCEIKNPPFSPQVVPQSDIVIGQINNRCWSSTTIAMNNPSMPEYPVQVKGWINAQVWQLGAWGCLQARKNFNMPWRNVWCEAAQVYHKAAIVLWLSHDGKRISRADPSKWWEWRVQGHAWVDYVAGGGLYSSTTVTSPFVPLPVKP